MPAARLERLVTPAATPSRRPLRVLHVDTESGWRGGERQVVLLSRGLMALGDVNLVVARPDQPLAARSTDAGIATLGLTPAFEADPRAAWALRRAIRRHGIDIVHAHTAHAVALAALATIGSRVPFVAARRVDFPLRRNAGTRWKYQRAAAVIAVSQAVANVVARASLATRVLVVPDGTDARRPRQPASADTLAALGVPRGAPLVVQVAQLVPHKDPLTFVRAMVAVRERVPGVHGVLVGSGPLRDDVAQAIRDHGLSEMVHLAGYRDDADQLLAAADVVTLSSREEGMGSVLLDALVFSRPVAATRAGGIPEIVRDGETGLLTAVGDAEALGASIARLLTDRALAGRMGSAARARAPEFSLEAMAMRTRETYEEVLGPRHLR